MSGLKKHTLAASKILYGSSAFIIFQVQRTGDLDW